jgi:hypothetical protein
MVERESFVRTFIGAFRPVIEKGFAESGPERWSWLAFDHAIEILEAHLPLLDEFEKDGLKDLLTMGALLIPLEERARRVRDMAAGAERYHELMEVLTWLGPVGSRILLSFL